jgi:hypothetical protein
MKNVRTLQREDKDEESHSATLSKSPELEIQGLALSIRRFPKGQFCGNKSTIIGEGKAYDYPPQGAVVMADRQQFFRPIEADPELAKILEASRTTAVTEEELREQRISFAFGNAPQDSQDRITKDSLRLASEHINCCRKAAVSTKFHVR